MKRPLWASVLVVLGLVTSARAESWVFNPSYYSHDPATQVRIGRQFSSGPLYSRPQGQYYTSGFRFNRSTINVRGQTFDNMNMFEGWVQVGAQY